MKNQEDEFYDELDQKHVHRSCCTGQTMIIFFVVLLIMAIGGTFYCYRKIKKINFSSKTVQSTFQDKNNFFEKLKLDPSQTTFEIVVTSEELTAIAAEGISGRNFIIKNIQAIIQNESIDIYGSLVKPLSSQIKIQTMPKVDNGKIKFEIQKFTAGDLNLPKFISNEVADVLNKTMDQKFQELYANYQVQNINLFDDTMIISGTLKGD